MENKMILTKNTLLYFLNNEFGNSCNFEVTTVLNNNSGWTGHVIIKETNNCNEDCKYLKQLNNSLSC